MRNTGASILRLTVIVSFFAAIGAHAQSTTLQFCNDCLPSPPDRLVRDVNGNPLVGTTHVAQLYMGASPDTLVATTAAPAPFRAAGTPLPGTWQRRTINIVSPLPGAVYLQVKVWDTAVATTYDQAAASPTGQYGRSEVFVYNPCSTPPTLDCDKMLNFRGFTLMPNPPDRVLVIRENGDRVDLLFSGTHTIQGASSLAGPWNTLTTSSAPYTDPSSGTNQQRFYRMQDEPGPTYSLNAVGYYRVNVCAGFSMIANQLNAHGGNTVANIFKSPPERTEIYKYNPSTGGYISLSYLGGAWEGDDLEMRLGPGEGAFLNSPMAQSLRFLGEVPLSGSVAIPPGFSIISSPIPRSGPIDQMGFPVAAEICIFQWNCAVTGYQSNCYLLGAWEGDGGGSAPVIALGESFWVLNPGPARMWNGTHCIDCP